MPFGVGGATLEIPPWGYGGSHLGPSSGPGTRLGG
jgi:hypothetical protein